MVAAIVGAAVVGYQWTQTRFFVGASGTSVAIYRGVQQDIGPISLSSVYRTTDLALTDLSDFSRKAVVTTISATDLADAERIVQQLDDASVR